MKNYIQRGEIVGLTAPNAIESGDVVVVGDLVGVASTDAEAGETVQTRLLGCFDLPKASVAISEGDSLYWDTDASSLTKTKDSNKLAGHAIASASSESATVRVRLIG